MTDRETEREREKSEMKAAVCSRLLLLAAQTNDSERDSARAPTATNERIPTTDHVITNTTTYNNSCLSVCQSAPVLHIAAVCVEQYLVVFTQRTQRTQRNGRDAIIVQHHHELFVQCSSERTCGDVNRRRRDCTNNYNNKILLLLLLLLLQLLHRLQVAFRRRRGCSERM